MKTPINKLTLSCVVILALGIGSAGLSHAAEPYNAMNTAKICPPLQASNRPSDTELLRKTDIRWAQSELRSRGLYHGSLDGVLGSETKAAILQLQKNAGLGQTASLDARTWAVLTGEVEAGEGSSMPPAASGGGASLPGSPAASGLGR